MTIHNENAQFEIAGPMAIGVGVGRRRRPMNRVKSCKSSFNDPTAMFVGSRIVQRRMALNLTQAEVAGQVKIYPKSGPNKNKERLLSRNALSTYEGGGHVPSLPILSGLATALEVNPGWLAFGDEGLPLNASANGPADHGPKFGIRELPVSISA